MPKKTKYLDTLGKVGFLEKKSEAMLEVSKVAIILPAIALNLSMKIKKIVALLNVI